MLRRTAAALALGASFLLAASPAFAAETAVVRLEGSIIEAAFTNVPPDFDWDNPPTGDYFFTWVFAADVVAVGAEEPGDRYACVDHWGFTVDENGEYGDKGDGVFACGEASTLSIDRRLSSGHLVATMPVIDCLAWDDETGECLEPVELGNLEIDLVLTGVGAIVRERGTSTGGVAGVYSYVQHGTASSRDATPEGTIALDGESLIAGATSSDARLVSASQGYVEVYLGD